MGKNFRFGENGFFKLYLALGLFKCSAIGKFNGRQVATNESCFAESC